MIFGRSQENQIWLLMALFMLLGVCYAIALPIFEGADEISHFRVIEFIADEQAIPHIMTHAEDVGHEAGQPPLYYALLAPFVGAIDRTDFSETVRMNPHFLHLNSNHVWVHLTDEGQRWQGVTLAVRIGRFLSLLIGAATVYFSAATAQLIAPDSETEKWFVLLTAAFVAFNPQFLAISASINNDNLVIMFCTIALFLTLRWHKTNDSTAKTPFLIGLVTGLAILSKVSGLAFGLVIGSVLLYRWWQTGRFGPAFKDGLLVTAGVLITAGWWLWRNQTLYGDPLGLGALRIAHVGTYRPIPLTLAQTISESKLLLKTFWLFPGNGTLFGPDWFYWVVNPLALIGLASFVLSQFSNTASSQKRLTLTPIVWASTIYLLLYYWISTVGATSQGRLLYPALSALVLLVMLGFWHLGALGRWLAGGLTLFLLIFAVATPFMITAPAFATPKALAADFDYPNPFGEPAITNEIDLRGHSATTRHASRGESPQVELFWEATSQVPESYYLILHLVDSAGTEVSRFEGYPLNGSYPTVSWRVGDAFTDEITMPPISENAAAGLATYFIELAAWDGSTSTDLRPLSEPVKIRLDTPPTMPELAADITFGNLAQLDGYTLEQTEDNLNITFTWSVLSPTNINQTIFVHLVDQQGNLIAQADSPPRVGTYPTNYWENGENIPDLHQIPLDSIPAGHYTISTGFYDPISGTRLPTEDNRGIKSDSFLFDVKLE